jgi:hypothetical protein
VPTSRSSRSAGERQFARPGVDEEVPAKFPSEISPEVVPEVDPRDRQQVLLADRLTQFAQGGVEVQVDHETPSIVSHGRVPLLLEEQEQLAC